MTITDVAPTIEEAPVASTPTAPGRNRVIPILLVAAFVVILNETAMNVALTRIMDDLQITERLAQWLTTAFMLTMAVVIPTTGWLIERLGTRRAYTTALGLFSLGTLICLVSPTISLLLAGRVVQASGTAIMMPLLMTTLMQLVEPAHRGRVMGNVSMVISVAPAVGPTLSGVLLAVGSWRLIFAVVLPIALAMLFLGRRGLTNVAEESGAKLDLWSIPLAVLGFGGAVYGLSLVGDATVPFWEPILAIGIGGAGLIAFIARQLVLQRTDSALLDLRTFTHTSFTLGVGLMALSMMGLFGTIITLPLLLQRAFAMTPLQVGLMMLPGGLLMGVLGPIVGRLYDRVGPRVLLVPALAVVAGVFAALSTLTTASPWWFVLVCHLTMSAAFAFIFTSLFTTALGALPRHLYSYGSASIGTIQQLAGAAGTALFVTVFSMQAQVARTAGASEAASLLAGSHWGFLGAGAVMTAAAITALFLSKPADAPEGIAAH
ncbi:MAG TPA: MDR family MFS transporter [Propioniciclava tarda]|nr:MDR family MFS transporter [Propioniciclava tarda]